MRAASGASNGVIVSRLAQNAEAVGTREQTGNGRLNLDRALADTSTDSVQPAGADPVGSGGPFVGPYVAANKNLNIVFAGTGGGTVAITASLTPQPSPSTCTANCTRALNNDAAGTLTATPATGSTFAGWSGTWVTPGTTTCSGATSPCNYSMGNKEQTITATFNGDTTAPTVTIDSLVGSTGTDSTSPFAALTNAGATINWHANENGSFSVRRGGTNCTTGTVVASGTYSTQPSIVATAIAAGDLIEGANTLRVCVTDSATNTGGSVDVTVTKDTTAPAAPSAPDLQAASDSGSSQTDNVTNDNSPTFDGTAETGSTVKLYRGSTEVASGTATGGNWTLTDPGPVADDSYLYKATATDAAGNTSVDSNTLSVTIDTLAPAVSDPDLQAGSDTGSSSSDNITKDTSPTFDGTAEAGVGVQLLRGATSVASGTATAGNWTLTDPTATPDDTYTYKGRATDLAGNSATSTPGLSVTIDTTAPAVSDPDLQSTSDSGSSQTDNITNDTSPTFDGTAEAGASVELLRGATSIASGTATAGNWTLTDPSATPDNSYTYKARATDLAGNVATSTPGLSVTVDTTAPAAPSAPDLQAASDSGSSQTDNVTNDNSPTFDGTAETGSTVKLYRGSTEVASGTATGGNWTLTDPGPSPTTTPSVQGHRN